MKMLPLILIPAALLSSAADVCAEPFALSPQVGATYEITMDRVTARQGSDGSGSSRSRNTLIERVIEIRTDGLVFEYDLPKQETAKSQTARWQFPAQIFKRADGPPQIANRSEMEARIENWLKEASIDRAYCGRWIFTWNAFRIECDPDSVIKTLEAFDVAVPDLDVGTSYRVVEAREPAPLARRAQGPDGATYGAEFQLDPDFVRRSRAEADVIVGEIMKKTVTFDEALLARENDTISGIVSVMLDADPEGNVRRRTKVTKLEIKRPDGRSEVETVTETVERRLVAAR